MRRFLHLIVGLSVVSIALAVFHARIVQGKSATLVSAKASPAPNPACVFPTTSAASMEETAWQLFVAANCPSNANKVVWEDWAEQLQVYPQGSPGIGTFSVQEQQTKRLHGSPLARLRAEQLHIAAPLLFAPSGPCPPMQTPPPNVVNGATVCEETRLNPEAQGFVTTNGYQLRPGQTAAAQKGTDIEFPTPAIEVKVDWIPATDFSPQFSCTQPPTGVHVESIDGVCYAMVGIHISSKLLKNWVWATFEPQSMLTNPLRCITFGACKDSWGSNPATSTGGANGFTDKTQALSSLMKQANLAPEFLNYRLDGVQIDFTNPDGTPTYLGNSIIEGENVGLTAKQASCISCHSVSSVKNDGLDGGFALIPANKLTNGTPVGAQYQAPAGWIARDFVWSMGIACPDPSGAGVRPPDSPCNSTVQPATKERKR